MIGLAQRCSVGTIVILGLAASAAESPAPPGKPDLAADYEAHELHGFRVMLSKKLPGGSSILRNIDSRLGDIVRVVPAVHLSFFRDVTVWVVSARESGIPESLIENAAAFYVRLETEFDPTKYGRLPPETKGGVVVLADRLLGDRKRRWETGSMPGWLMHEMGHAIHDRILGFRYSAVTTAYQQAMDRKLYDAVDTRFFEDLGQFRVERRPAYARTNHCEYFPELSAAYLNLPGRYFPFSRDDLADHDPGGSLVMDAFWRPAKCRIVNDFPFAVSIDRLTESRRRFRLCELMPGKETAFEGFEGMSLVVTSKVAGRQYRVQKPEKDGRTWRLSADTTTFFIDLSTLLQKPSR